MRIQAWSRVTALASFFVAVGCAGTPAPADPVHGHGHPHASAHAANDPASEKLAEVARIHGGAGPWAVAGYRMGEHALSVLGLPRGSFDLEVVHHTPREVQYSCIADGAAAATGASMGKLNLSLAEAPPEATRTTYRRKSTGKSVTLKLTASFVARFTNIPRDQLAEAGRAVIALRDEEIFEEV